MDLDLEYLLNFLEDEFRDWPEVSVKLAPRLAERLPTRGPYAVPERKSRPYEREQGMIEDEADELSRTQGVTVRTGRREYFFPETWVRGQRFQEIQKLAREIKDTLP